MNNSSPNSENTSIERITMRRVWESILAAFTLDKGLFYTLRAMTLFPARAIKTYLIADRSKLMKPLRFLILTVGITTFIILQLLSYLPSSSDQSLMELEKLSPQLKGVGQWINDFLLRYFNIFQLIKVPFLSLAALWLYRKAQFNYAEHLVINAYIFSYQTLISTLFFPLVIFSGPILLLPMTLIVFGYMAFVFIKIYNDSPFVSFLKSLACYFIATIFHGLFIALVFVILFLLGWN